MQIGLLTHVAMDTVGFLRDRSPSAMYFATSSNAKIDVSDGVHGHAVKGAVIGLGSAAALSAVSVATTSGSIAGRMEAVPFLLIFGDLIGAGVGALIRTERWVLVAMR